MPEARQLFAANADKLAGVLHLLGELMIDQSRLRQSARMIACEEAGKAAGARRGEPDKEWERIAESLRSRERELKSMPICELLAKYPEMQRDLEHVWHGRLLGAGGSLPYLDGALLQELGESMLYLLRGVCQYDVELPRRNKRQFGVSISLQIKDKQAMMMIREKSGGGRVKPRRCMAARSKLFKLRIPLSALPSMGRPVRIGEHILC